MSTKKQPRKTARLVLYGIAFRTLRGVVAGGSDRTMCSARSQDEPCQAQPHLSRRKERASRPASLEAGR